MTKLSTGRINLATGLLLITAFMAYGFFLIYLRDFAPDKEQWIADYGRGEHFEARLAHVHGALFAVLNIILGVVVPVIRSAKARAWVAGLGLLGMLMPVGILMEVYLHTSPAPVLVGGVAIFASFLLAGVAVLRNPQATATPAIPTAAA